MFQIELEALKENSAYRQIKSVPKGCLNLSSNDYLGISSDEALQKEFLNTYQGRLFNPSARLLTNSEAFDALERQLEKLLNKERALLFNSGYHANVGIYSTFARAGDVVFCDRLNHASIIDGIKMGGAKLIPFKHLDYEDLRHKLRKYRKKFKKAIISSDTLFSMDGDFADTETLLRLRDEFDCLLFVDEAHTFGVFESTRGADLIMGTFGKAIGAYGAFCAGSEALINYLVNFARSFIFSTTFPPLCAAFAGFILNKDLSPRKEKLFTLSKLMREELGLAGSGYIIPVVLGENAAALSEKLIQHGYWALPIRYPTVARGSERVRLSLNASMEWEELKGCVEIIKGFAA